MTSQYPADPAPNARVDPGRRRDARSDDVAPPQGSFFPALWRNKFALTAGAVLGVALGLLITLLQPVTYLSESRVFFSSQNTFDPLGTNSFTSDPTRYLEQQAALLTSEPVLSRAVESDESIGDLTEVQEALTVTASSEADIVTVKAAADTGARATARVEAVVDAYRALQQANIADQTRALAGLSTAGERRQVEQRAALYGDGVDLVEPAGAEKATGLIRNTTIGGLVGLLVALGWAFTRQQPTSSAVTRRPFAKGTREHNGRNGVADGDWEWRTVAHK